ncbi:MAG: hypothetical protein AB1485_01745 [Candidatus Thermoplasmatota archaeon]
MKCAYHLEKDAMVQCASCFRAICGECSIVIEGRAYCKPCLSAAVSKPPQPFPYYVPPPPPYYAPAKPTDLTAAGGGLLLATGVLGLLTILFLFMFMGYPFYPYGCGYGYYLFPYILCPIIIVIFSILAILGGVCSLQKRSFGLAITGSVLGIFTWGFYIGSILSIIALIFIAISKDAFRK